jgi:CRP/FNR family transcriptional regulator, cyclic AMP receptor protein
MSDQMAPPAGALTPDYLRTIGLFGALSEDALVMLASTLRERTVEAGEFVFHEQDEGRDLYLIIDGEVEIVKQTKVGHEIKLSRITSGQWFGDMSVLDIQRRFAGVRAIVPSRLLQLSSRDLDALYRRDIKSYTLLVLNLARELSRRLRVVDELVFSLMAQLRDHHLGFS